MTTVSSTRRPLSAVERAILILHGLVAATYGVVGFMGADDPDWGDIQRLLIVLLTGLWGGGIVAMALVARLVDNPWLRAAILLAGPFLGIALLVGATMLGWR